MEEICKKKYPNVYDGHQYALDIVSGKIVACIYVIGACKRYLKDLERIKEKDCPFYFDYDAAEKFLNRVQRFKHVKGEWESPFILYKPWQKFRFMNIFGFMLHETKKRRFRTAYNEVARGNGKALDLYTEIPTPSGIRLFGELEVGDSVYDRNGNVCKITGKTSVHKTESYKITFNTGESVLASGEHLWFSSDKNERERLSRHTSKPPIRKDANKVYESIRKTSEMAKNVKKRSEANFSLPVSGAIAGEQKEFSIDPYVMGYWIGNGGYDRSVITCNSIDTLSLVEIFKSKGEKVLTVTNCRERNSSSISLSNLYSRVKGYETSPKNRIPVEYLTSSYEQRLELLRGLLDSDGYLDKSGRVEFVTVSETLAEDVLYLISSFGNKVTVIEKNIENISTRSKVAYRVYFKPRGVEYFNLERKGKTEDRELYFEYLSKRYIKKIEKVNDLPMMCIEVDSPDNSFLITRHCIPTHNSAEAAQTGLYMLALDNPKGNEVYSAATGREQARIILDSSRAMAKANKGFCDATGTKVMSHKIIHDASNSFFKALSSDSSTLDGLQPACALIDELHSHKNRGVYDVIDSAMSKRNDSLMFMITTAGFDTTGIGYDVSQYAKQVALGIVEDDSFFSIIYTIDKKNEEFGVLEDDDPFDEKIWIKANPNLGVSVDPINFASKADKAKVNPSDRNNFLVKHLNIWTDAKDPFFNLIKWDECANSKLKLEDFVGEKCYVGIDLASKVDLTSIAYVFKKEEKFYVFCDNYCPEETVFNSTNQNYEKWKESSELIVTRGAAINYPLLEEQVIGKSKQLRFLDVHYDPWNATEFAQRLSQKRIEMVEFRMNTANLSEPMKRLDALIREGKLEHNNSSLLRWCLGNVVAKYDANDNVFPRKDSEEQKIDPIVAIIMAIAGWIQEEQNESVYKTRGIIVL